MKIVTYKCDRCGMIPENGLREGWGTLRLTTDSAVFACDLCPPCSSQIKGDVSFELRGKPPGKRRAKAAA